MFFSVHIGIIRYKSGLSLCNNIARLDLSVNETTKGSFYTYIVYTYVATSHFYFILWRFHESVPSILFNVDKRNFETNSLTIHGVEIINKKKKTRKVVNKFTVWVSPFAPNCISYPLKIPSGRLVSRETIKG